MLRRLALLLLLAPAAALASGRTATLRVAAQVRPSLRVSVEERSGAPAIVVTAAGVSWSGPLAGAGRASAGAVSVARSAEHPGYVVVTVLADVRN